MFRRLYLLLLLVMGMGSLQVHAQMLNAGQFPGDTVGNKVTAAQAGCIVGMSCAITIPADLSTWPAGTLPTKCALCTWYDYRTPNALAADLISPTNPFFNVKAAKYGAKGDGVTDDLNAIQSALNDANGTCGTVYIPQGTYLLNHYQNQNGVRFYNLNVYSCTKIEGAGQLATMLKVGPNMGDQTRVFSLNSADQVNTGDLSAAMAGGTANVTQFVLFQDFTFDMNAAGQPESGCPSSTKACSMAGISPVFAQNIIVNRVTCLNPKGDTTNEGVCFDFYGSYNGVVRDSKCMVTDGSTNVGSCYSSTLSTNATYDTDTCDYNTGTTWQCFTTHKDNHIQYINTKALRCGQRCYNAEFSQDLTYNGAQGGGITNAFGVSGPFAASTQLGNLGKAAGGDCFFLFHDNGVAIGQSTAAYCKNSGLANINSYNVTVNGFVSHHNGQFGISDQGEENEGAGMRVKGLTSYANTLGNALFNRAAFTTPIPGIVTAPAIPASNTTITNPYPFEALVTIVNSTAATTVTEDAAILFPAMNSGTTALQTLNILQGGRGYAGNPTVTFTGGGPCSTMPTATATVTSGVVTSVNLTNAGAGCIWSPTARLSGVASGATVMIVPASTTASVVVPAGQTITLTYTVAPTSWIWTLQN